MFNKLKSAAMAVLVASAVAVAGAPIVTFQAHAADAPAAPSAMDKKGDMKKTTKKKVAKKKSTAKKMDKKMDNMSK